MKIFFLSLNSVPLGGCVVFYSESACDTSEIVGLYNVHCSLLVMIIISTAYFIFTNDNISWLSAVYIETEWFKLFGRGYVQTGLGSEFFLKI